MAAALRVDVKKTWATAFRFVCTVLVLDACQVASGLSDLHAATSETSPRSDAGEKLLPSSGGMGGESSTTTMIEAIPSTPMPEAGASAIEKDGPKASMDAGMSGANASGSGAPNAPHAPNDSHAMDAGVPTKAPTNTSDAGALDAQTTGSPKVTDKQQPEAAGAESMPLPAGSMASQIPRAGAESTLPLDPMCTPAFPGATCGTAPQCGCNQGDNCAYLAFDFPACVRAGSAGLNQRCSIVSDCQPGLQCIAGACLQLCDPNQHACDNEAACNQNFSSGRAIPGHFTCSSHCNLVDPQRPTETLAACGAGVTCLLFGEGSDCAASTFATGKHGESCESSLDCAPGYNCMEHGTCARWCETPSDCGDGFWCEDINVSVGNTQFGLCRPNCSDAREVGCEVNPQCGCENGMTCDFFRQQDNRYIHACRQPGRGAPYSRCEYDEDCGATTSCVGSRCAPFCDRDSDCGGTYAQCLQVNNGNVANNPPIPGFQVCSRPCDPADITRPHGAYQSCPAGDACATSMDGRSYCRTANDQAESGAACTRSADCAVGFECSLSHGCAPQCQINADCASGYACAAFSPRMFADAQEWGICVVVQQSGQTP